MNGERLSSAVFTLAILMWKTLVEQRLNFWRIASFRRHPAGARCRAATCSDAALIAAGAVPTTAECRGDRSAAGACAGARACADSKTILSRRSVRNRDQGDPDRALVDRGIASFLPINRHYPSIFFNRLAGQSWPNFSKLGVRFSGLSNLQLTGRRRAATREHLCQSRCTLMLSSSSSVDCSDCPS